MGMTNRELFLATMAGKNGDELLHIEMGFWQETYDRWLTEGLSAKWVYPSFDGLSEAPELYDCFQISKLVYCSFADRYFPKPSNGDDILEETDGERVVKDYLGNIIRCRTDGISLPQLIESGIKTKSDYVAVREFFLGSYEQRVRQMEWLPSASRLRVQQDHIICLKIVGPFAALRSLVGAESAMTLPYDDPDFTRLVLNDHLCVCKGASDIILDVCPVDCSFVWEDNCYKNGPMVSPDIFRQFYLPFYSEWTQFLKQRNVDYTIVDTDGDPTVLLPLWLEGGVSGMLPWEANAVNIEKVASAHPNLVFIGGISKHAVARTEDTAKAVDSIVRPMRDRGRYIAGLDHLVPPEIGLSTFQQYCDILSSFGKANNLTG